jgi:uracil-DNA glycosylase
MNGINTENISILDGVSLDSEWQCLLGAEFAKPYMRDLMAFLQQETASGHVVFPKIVDIFNAFNSTPPSKVKVVILGQDPYHGPGQAHGYCFSVPAGVRAPPSLQNIFKEIKSDLGLPLPVTSTLTPWANQGVLLLNTVLTVQSGRAASHRKRGWEIFTDLVIKLLSQRSDPIAFLLWGNFAHAKADMIRCPPHLVLKATHPSPLSAYNGWWGSKHFSKANRFLEEHGRAPIDWRLP